MADWKILRDNPELEAEWAELERVTKARLGDLRASLRDWEEREEREARRRLQLRRLTFGLLGR